MSEFPLMNDISLQTTLNNLMEAAEARLNSLDHVSEILSDTNRIDFQQILSAALRTCTDINAANEVIQSIKQLLFFYLKYEIIKDEWITKRLEKRLILSLKAKLIKASIRTMHSFDYVSVAMYGNVMKNRNVIKNDFAIDGDAINSIKNRFRRKRGGKD